MIELDNQELEHKKLGMPTKDMEDLCAELLETHEQYEQERQLYESGPAIIFRWGTTPQWPVEYVSPNIEAILGHNVEDLVSGELKFFTLIHPDDIDRVSKVVNDFLQQGDGFFQTEYRLIDGDGDYHWLFSHVMLTNNRRDDSSSFIGYVLDITERKVSEEQLNLAATAMESSVAISITDPVGTILRVNEAYTEITGYSAEEVVGQNSSILNSGKHNKEFFDSLWYALNNEGYWEGEIWNKKKSGDIFPEWISITATRDSDGNITHYVSNFQDISERKSAENHIERLAYFDPLTSLPNRRL